MKASLPYSPIKTSLGQTVMRFSITFQVACRDSSCLLCQVVELLNQAALMSTDEKLTVLKQVCAHFRSEPLKTCREWKLQLHVAAYERSCELCDEY